MYPTGEEFSIFVSSNSPSYSPFSSSVLNLLLLLRDNENDLSYAKISVNQFPEFSFPYSQIKDSTSSTFSLCTTPQWSPARLKRLLYTSYLINQVRDWYKQSEVILDATSFSSSRFFKFTCRQQHGQVREPCRLFSRKSLELLLRDKIWV